MRSQNDLETRQVGDTPVVDGGLQTGNKTANGTSAAVLPRSTADTVAKIGTDGVTYHEYKNNGDPGVKRRETNGLPGIAAEGNVTPDNTTSAS